MDSDQLPFKNIPYIPPSSPPPIDTIPKEIDYEISDNEGVYDITGLSQKFGLCEEENLKSSNLFTDKDNEIFSKSDTMYVDSEHCYPLEENYLKSAYDVTEDCRNFSTMSPPPLNYDQPSSESSPDLKVMNTCDKDSRPPCNNGTIDTHNEEILHNETEPIALIKENNDQNVNNTIDIYENSNIEKMRNDSPALESNEESNLSKLPCNESELSDKINHSEEKNISFQSVDNEDINNFRNESPVTEFTECKAINVTEITVKNIENESCESQSASIDLSSETTNEKELLPEEIVREKSLSNEEPEECTKLSESSVKIGGEEDINLNCISECNSTFETDVIHINKSKNNNEVNIDIVKGSSDQLELNDDDDDDFGDFSSINFNCSIQDTRKDITVSKVPSDEEQDDEFGDFAVSRDSGAVNETKVDESGFVEFQDTGTALNNSEEKVKDEFDDFGDFSNYKETRTEDYPEFDINEEDEFGEFTTVETSEGLQLEFSDDEEYVNEKKLSDGSKESLKETNVGDYKFQHPILRWTPNSNELNSGANENVNLGKLSDVLESDAFMWCHLVDIDSSQALQLSWPNSRVNKLFLSSLNVDARNILFGHKPKWSSTIPLFAQTLSFSPLTPLKPSTVSNTWNLDNKTLDLEQSPVVSEKVESPPVIPSPKKVQDSEAKIIPPAKFDWSSSGLTNPLDGPGIEKEILTPSDDKISSVIAGSKPQVAPSPILEKILKESEHAPTGKQINTNLKSLPSEVKEVVEKLPDLNFMRSKVLMFPILEGT